MSLHMYIILYINIELNVMNIFHLSKSSDFPNHYKEHKFGKKIGKEIGSFAKDNMINFKKTSNFLSNFSFPIHYKKRSTS